MLALVRANWGLASAAMAAANADPDHMGWFVGLQRAATRGEVAARMLEVIHEMDIAPRLTDVRAPTLVVHRKGDRVHPFEFAKEIAAGIADARLEALEGDIYWPWWGDSEALVKVIRGFLGDDTASAEVPTTPTAIERKLTAILSADVVGYSRLMAQDDIATVEQVNASRKTMAEQIQQHGGRVVDAVGDDLLAEFRSVVDAVRSAAAIQRALAEHNDPLEETRRMRWRIGVNLGDVIVQEDRLYGDGVNIAARVQALADPGGIAISGTAHEHVESKLALSFEDLGEHEVKNIPRPVRVYRIVAPREGFGG
jgi:class 3 adenylate cyclase